MTAHIRRIDGKLVLTLDDTLVAALSPVEGDAFEVEVRGEELVLHRPAPDGSERLARGRAFIDRYRDTFLALAK